MIDRLSQKPSLVKLSTDPSTAVAVVGNSGSVSELSNDQYNLINNSRLLRCNWAFNDPSPVKKEYTMYFSQAYPMEQEGLKDELDFACDARLVHIYNSITHVLFDRAPGLCFLTSNGTPVYGTSGGQMLLHAAFQMRPKKLNIAGIDLYTHNKPKCINNTELLKYLTTTGKPYSKNNTGSIGINMRKENLTYVTPEHYIAALKKSKMTQHFIETDILLLLRSLVQLHILKTDITFMKTPGLEELYNIAGDNIDLFKNYFKPNRDFVRDNDTFGICYDVARLINKIIQSYV